MKNSDSYTVDDQKRHSLFEDIAACLAFFTRLPVSTRYIRKDIASAVRGFGAVGLVIGLFCGIVFWLATSLSISASIAGFLALATGFLITGGLHEDGLGDVADGFGGGWTRERKLEIMRDSSIGTYGILALIVFVAIRGLGFGQLIGSNASLVQCVLIFAGIGCLSRIPMIWMMRQLDMARTDGRAVEAGRPSAHNTQTGIAMGAGVSFLIFWISIGFAAGIFAILASGAAYYIVKRLATAQIGGYTGDVLGFLQQFCEILLILSLIATF